jgi:hypothetical protein
LLRPCRRRPRKVDPWYKDRAKTIRETRQIPLAGFFFGAAPVLAGLGLADLYIARVYTRGQALLLPLTPALTKS